MAHFCIETVLLAILVCSGSATVDLHEMEARLTLMEASQRVIQQELARLGLEHVQDIVNVSQFCQGIKDSVDNLRNSVESVGEQEQGSQAHLTGPCKAGNHTVLDDPWRSIYAERLSFSVLCDSRLAYGWYRFLLNGRNAVIPTQCVEEGHCTTNSPVWINLYGRSLPEVGQELDARACATQDRDCCSSGSPITIRNCGEYFVYYLQPQNACSLAFCAERQT